jgi:hypothetical protein
VRPSPQVKDYPLKKFSYPVTPEVFQSPKISNNNSPRSIQRNIIVMQLKLVRPVQSPRKKSGRELQQSRDLSDRYVMAASRPVVAEG